MKRSSIFLLVCAAWLSLGASPARAQDNVTTAPPIVIKRKAPKPKTEVFKGEVLHADQVSLIVRSLSDTRFVRTFTYSLNAQKQMAKVLEGGGYQYGDKVEIRYLPGQDVALDIRGRASKPR